MVFGCVLGGFVFVFVLLHAAKVRSSCIEAKQNDVVTQAKNCKQTNLQIRPTL